MKKYVVKMKNCFVNKETDQFGTKNKNYKKTVLLSLSCFYPEYYNHYTSFMMGFSRNWRKKKFPTWTLLYASGETKMDIGLKHLTHAKKCNNIQLVVAQWSKF